VRIESGNVTRRRKRHSPAPQLVNEELGILTAYGMLLLVYELLCVCCPEQLLTVLHSVPSMVRPGACS
jgi:hypothetical protein